MNTSTRRDVAWWGLAALLVTAALMLPKLLQGWYPHDEGILGQSAERILRGDMPHRDFDETYTGLLSYWHALAFTLGGASSATMRWVFLGVTMAWSMAVFSLARRAVPNWAAVAVTALCVLWGPVNYPAPMPSWYNLYLATFGVFALLGFQDRGKLRWVVLAGVAGGLSFLVKLSGVAFLLGATLGIIATTSTAETGSAPDAEAPIATRLGSAVVASGLVTMLVVLWIPLAGAGPRYVARLWLPIAVLAAGIAVREWRLGAPVRARIRELVRAFVALALGVSAVVIPYALFVWQAHGLDATLVGVFVTPFRRVAAASVRPMALSALLGSALVALVLIPRRTEATGRRLAVLTGIAGILMIALSKSSVLVYRTLWATAWGLPLLTAVWASLQLATARRGSTDAAVTVSCVAVAALLVEFPFAAPIYTLYALPLSLLAIAMLGRTERGTSAATLLSVGVVLLAFAFVRLHPGGVLNLGYRYAVSADTIPLDVERSGLQVGAKDASRYRDLVRTVQVLAPGRTLWAGPDAPEVSFLTGVPSVGRTTFDFLAVDASAARSVADRILRSEASLVVLNPSPQFSSAPTADDMAALRAAYPNGRLIGGFWVIWR